MFKYTKTLALTAALLIVSSGVFANPTDSTSLNSQYIHPTLNIQDYLLAQGTVSTMQTAFPYNVTNTWTTNKRCNKGMHPVLITSIKDSYVNGFYAFGGITNTITLSRDYRLNGQLRMDNRGAVGGNVYSPATASWQVWCQAA